MVVRIFREVLVCFTQEDIFHNVFTRLFHRLNTSLIILGLSKPAVNDRICYKYNTYSSAMSDDCDGSSGDFSEGRGGSSGDLGTRRSLLVTGVSLCLVLAGAGVTISRLDCFSDDAHCMFRVSTHLGDRVSCLRFFLGVASEGVLLQSIRISS